MRRARPANLWLGLFIAAYASLALADSFNRFPAVFGLFDWPLPAMGPCFYLYVQVLTTRPLARRDLLHLAPTLAWSLFLAGGRLLMPGFYPWMVHPGLSVLPLVILATQLATLVYALLVLRLLWRFKRRVRQTCSSLQGRDLRWLSGLSGALLLMLLAWVPVILLGGIWSIAMLFARLLLLIGIGWFGLRQPAIFLPDPAPAPEPAMADKADKYARSGMNQAARELIGERLRRRAAQAGDHLECDFKLADLAGRIGTSPQLLSQYLNEELGQNFFEYINGLRVAEVQRMLRDPGLQDRPLLDLAMEAGFSSKSTFNAAFKKQTGMAPSAWRTALEHASGTSIPIG